jgi:hypothetical protein
VALFAAIVLGIVVWAIVCLAYVHVVKTRVQHSPTLDAAFRKGNPFKVTNGGFMNIIHTILGCWCIQPAKAREGGCVEEEVAVKPLTDGTLIVIKQSSN